MDVFVGNELVIDGKTPTSVNESEIILTQPEAITAEELAPILQAVFEIV